MLMLISFIIPLYNCGPYIARCLDSVLNQGLTIEQYEVIIVNDGSTDDGPIIAQQYTERYSNFHIIHQSNQGAGPAKNTGVLASKGDYLLFLDSDDWLMKGGIDHLIENTKLDLQESNIDIAAFEFQHVLKSNEEKRHFPTQPIYFTGTLQEFANKYGLRANCTNTLIRADFIKRILFKRQAIAEDFNFMTHLYHRHPSCTLVALSSPIYCYYIRQGSATNNVTKEFVKEAVNIYSNIYKEIKQEKLLDGYDKSKVNYFILTFIQCMAITRILSANLKLNEIKLLMNECLESGMFPILTITSKQVRLLAFASKGYLNAWMLSKLYRNIYLKYIK